RRTLQPHLPAGFIRCRMFTGGIDIHQMQMQNFEECLIRKHRPVIGIMIRSAFPASECSSRQRGEQLIIEVVEERFDCPFEMRSSWWIEVQFDSQLKRRLLKILADQVRSPVADNPLRDPEAGPGPLNPWKLF